jgi:hypothetical protein
MVRKPPIPSKPNRRTTNKTATVVRKLASTAKSAKTAAVRANRARAKELLALVARRREEIVEAFYDIGEALRELSKRKHYESLGCESFKELLAKKKVMSATQAFKLIKIVKNVPRDTALSLGQERAAALIGLAEATPEDDTVAELADDTRDGTPLRSASKRKIEQLAGETRKKHHKPSADERAAAKALRAAAATVRKHFASAGLRGVAVETVDGRVRVVLTVEQAEKLAAND